MLRQIIKDLYVDPEVLAELSDEQKQVLFIKMREEQVRRWTERETELDKKEVLISPKKTSKNKKGTNVHYLIARDDNPWVWVMGESDEDSNEDEKEKSLQASDDKESECKAKEIAEKEAEELRKKELADIELRASKRKIEQEKIEKNCVERGKLLKERRKMFEQNNQQVVNKVAIKTDGRPQRDLQKERKDKEEADRKKLAEITEQRRKEEEEKRRKELQKKENERKLKEEADRKKTEELRKKEQLIKQEREMQELARKEAEDKRREEEGQARKVAAEKRRQALLEQERKELARNAEEKRIQELEKQKKEEEQRLIELEELKKKEEEERIAKEKELQEKQEKRTRELYEKIKQQKIEDRRREEELKKKDYEAWVEREKRAKEAEFQRRSSVSMARKEVKRQEEEVKELQKQGFIEVASGLYRRFSQSKSKVHRVDVKQTENTKKQRPTISSPELISATGVPTSVRSIKPPKPERSPPSIPRRPSSRLGPAPPPPVNNGNIVSQKRMARPHNRKEIIEWWQEVELAKGAGFDNNEVFPWFHGIITRQEAESLLEEKPTGSFLVRVSERVWGYTISYRAENRCKHFLIDTSDNSYQFFGHSQIAHASLADLVKFHESKPVSGIGKELLLVACGQKNDEPDYKELVSQNTVI